MTAPATAAAGEQGWVRLHPLTPLLRGGRFGLLLLALAGQQGLRNSPPEAVAAVLGAGVPAGIFVGWLSWRAMRYRVTATELQVESGVVTKRSRRVPLARVQAVDVVRPLYARVLGLAELRLEVVGAGDAEAPLSFLADDRARLLRTQLLDLAAGREAAVEGAPAPEPDRVLVRVPTGPLVWSTLLGPPVVTLVALTVALLLERPVGVRYFGLSFPRGTAGAVSAICVQENKGGDLVPPGKGLLVAFARPDVAADLIARGAREVLAEVMPDIEKAFPGVERAIVRARIYRWEHGQATFYPGYLGRLAAFRAGGIEADAPVTLAGDYLLFPAIEGAVATGQDAADRLLARLAA